jgi:signal transduction histidine kinase
VNFKTTISEDFSGKQLQPEVRRNIYLIFKEAVNNAAKYSEATEVELQITLKKGLFQMTIMDNGKGFDVDSAPAEGSGNGLKNMRQRAADIGGKVEIFSKTGQGTRVEMQVNV